MPQVESTVDPRAALLELWRRGSLRWLLRDYQRDILSLLEHDAIMSVALCSVRSGKTYAAFAAAAEMGFRKRNASIKFAYPTLKQAKKVVVPTAREIFATCPPEMCPRFNIADMTWTFPTTGSVIHLAGCETEEDCDGLRGDKVDLGVVDEAAFIRHLGYLIDSVLKPRTLTTGGKLLLTSSAPYEPNHAFRMFYERAKLDGAMRFYTIDILRSVYGDETIDRYIEEAGGRTATKCRREYFCEFVPEEDRAIVPEFIDAAGHIVEARDRPQYCFKYVVGDLAFEDLCFVLYGFHDFENDLIVIEDEVVTNRKASADLADQMRERERELWGEKAQALRYADAPAQTRHDIASHSGILFALPPKTDADAALNAMRVLIQKHRIRIHPRCRQLIAHLENGTWNVSRSHFERMDGFGHFDGIDALKYFARVVNRRANPFPAMPPGITPETHFIPNVPEAPIRRGIRDAFVRNF